MTHPTKFFLEDLEQRLTDTIDNNTREERSQDKQLKSSLGNNLTHDSSTRMPLWKWMFLAAWTKTRGTARMDLKRPTFPVSSGPPTGLLRRRRRQGRAQGGSQFVTQPGVGYEAGYDDDAYSAQPTTSYRSGAQLKVMRYIDIGPKRPPLVPTLPPPLVIEPPSSPEGSISGDPHSSASSSLDRSSRHHHQHPHDLSPGLWEGEPSSPSSWQSTAKHDERHGAAPLATAAEPPAAAGRSRRSSILDFWRDRPRPVQLRAPVNFGAGLRLDLDQVTLRPQVRLKIMDIVTVQLLPEAMLKLQWKMALGSSGLALRALYTVPLDQVDRFWMNPPARLLIRLDNCGGTGVHFTPSGIEFDESARLSEQPDVSVRLAAGASFPRQIMPYDDSSKLLNLKLHRVSLKTSF